MTRIVVPALLLLLGLTTPGAMAQKMYWTEWGSSTIFRSNLDGSSIETLVTGQTAPYGIALDVAAGEMYWTSNDVIRKANLDGTGVVTLVTGQTFIKDIVLDPTGGKMYWAANLAGMIRRSDLNGSNIEDLVAGLNSPAGMAIDVPAGKVYWGDVNNDLIQRSNLDGSSVEVIHSAVDGWYIELDLAAGKLYWTEPWYIKRSDLSGANVETLLGSGSTLWHRGLGLDIPSGHMYYCNSWDNNIKRANIDGSAPTFILTSRPGAQGLALDLPLPLTCTINAPIVGSTESDLIAVDHDVSGPTGTASALFEYSTNGGFNFAGCDPGAGINPDTISVPGASFSFTWDSVADSVGIGGVQSTILRITVDDGATVTTCEVSIQVDNQPACIYLLCGDCDGNGFVTILDALMAARIDAGLSPAPAAGSVQYNNCNVSGAPHPLPGATISVLDALALAQHVAGLLIVTCC